MRCCYRFNSTTFLCLSYASSWSSIENIVFSFFVCLMTSDLYSFLFCFCFCFVLFCFVSVFVLFCFVLFCFVFVLFCFALLCFCFVLFCFVLFCFVLFLFCFVLFLFLFGFVLCLMPSDVCVSGLYILDSPFAFL